ncbi:DUF2267 domain-containing protein [Streptomyces rubradiris]|uniref:DUF2267 domain-containing protein n=1 Tax=Streptomyces rubradiris TaxID=285531 RepID=A0ABQ3R960_STRRR|nr:DUF2267 domain-containing protein [Streptomyces rubradiris]GHG99460.1 hypothetical protein GCM10018792_12870 [Streptomyces rubradiris]GHI52386.1 hypothetical protein Srubr_22320 [Streptomyces rubradiris]
MKLVDFLAQVRDRGEYRSQEEAEHISTSVLRVLATRISPEEADDLAARLPAPLDDVLHVHPERPEALGREEFLRRVAEQTGARPRTAEWDAGAVLSTVADAVPGAEVDHLLSQLPAGYADLFGRPGPA